MKLECPTRVLLSVCKFAKNFLTLRESKFVSSKFKTDDLLGEHVQNLLPVNPLYQEFAEAIHFLRESWITVPESLPKQFRFVNKTFSQQKVGERQKCIQRRNS